MPVPPAIAAPASDRPPHALTGEAVAAGLGVDPGAGLSPDEAVARLERFGRNEPATPTRPLVARAALAGLVDPLTLLLTALLVAALLVRDIPAALLLAAALVVDLVVGANERLKVAAPVVGIEALWAATAMVRRGGRVIAVHASELVPGDVIALAAGDVVPADARVLEAAACQVDESAVTGLADPSAKGPDAVADASAALADRAAMVYAGSRVLTGSATAIVTATGSSSELGAIAETLGSVERGSTPLERRLRARSVGIALVAVGAVAVAVLAGWYRGEPLDRLLVLGMAMGVAAIPAGRTTFLRATLAVGVQRLAALGVVARSLQAVGALGSVDAADIEANGILTYGIPTARSVLYRGGWYTVEGDGAATTGRMLHVAGATLPDFDRLAYIAALARAPGGAPERPAGSSPTEAALVVLAAKLGVDAGQSRRAFPRVAGLPYDATLGLAASVHRLPLDGPGSSVAALLVVGTPEAVLEWSTVAEWAADAPVAIASVRSELEAARDRMRSDGMQVVALALRRLDRPDDDRVDPRALVDELAVVGLVGILDPVRPSTAPVLADLTRAGVECRVVSGEAIAATVSVVTDLGLDGATVAGPELEGWPLDELQARLAGLRAAARMPALARLRLVRALRDAGRVVAVVGRGVVDGPALRAADAGVAVGPAAPVAATAASVLVPDGALATLVRAVTVGRETLQRVGAVRRLVATQLAALLALFLGAAVLGINEGLPLLPVQVLVVGLLVAVFPVVAIAADVPDPDVLAEPPGAPRDMADGRSAVVRRGVAGVALGLATLAVYPLCEVLGWGDPAFDRASVPTTMAFATMGVGTILAGLASRRAVDWAFRSPLPRFLGFLALPLVLLFLATELRVLQEFLSTVDLRQEEWGVALLLGTSAFWVIEADKLLQRRVRIRFH